MLTILIKTIYTDWTYNMDKKSITLIGFIVISVAVVVSAVLGTLLSPLNGYEEIQCNNIVRRDGTLVCEIELREEDDNIRIYKRH